MKFLTEEWRKAYEPRIMDAFSAASTPTKLTISFCEGFGAVPQLDSRDFWYRYNFVNGVMTEVQFGFGMDTAPQSDYQTFASYDVTKKIMTGEMGAAKALIGGKIKLKGSMTKALKLVDAYSVMQKVRALDGKTEW